MTNSYLFLANGFEEVEALATVDVLRRAGMTVFTVSINDNPMVTGAHGITVVADKLYTEVRDFNNAEWLICPGGMPGAQNLHEFDPLSALLKAHAADGGKVAAICAAPAVVLAPLGLLNKKEATCYPGFEDACKACGSKMKDAPVVVAGNIVTGNGPASAIPFALAIVKISKGADFAQQVGSGLLFYPKQQNFYF